MSALMRLKALTGIDILEELASKHLYIMLANSIQLKLNTYVYSGIFEAWLVGHSPLAPTWGNLLQVLRDINMEDLAKCIEQFFRQRSKESEVMGEEKELVNSLQQSLAKVERELHESEEQNQLLKTLNESLSTENEVLRRQLKQLPSVEPSGMVCTSHESVQFIHSIHVHI